MNINQLPCPSGRYWRIREGDTLYLIALRLGTTVNELTQLNPNINPNNLRIGQQLCLPVEQICPSKVFWEVAPGDTLYSIARATGTTVKKLLKLNPQINPRNLQVGQTICLPE